MELEFLLGTTVIILKCSIHLHEHDHLGICTMIPNSMSGAM